MNKIDLHVHSKYSDDGEFSVQDIIKKCINNKIDTLSITDHNSVRGINEAISISSQSGIELISGIEIDCNYNIYICWDIILIGVVMILLI